MNNLKKVNVEAGTGTVFIYNGKTSEFFTIGKQYTVTSSSYDNGTSDTTVTFQDDQRSKHTVSEKFLIRNFKTV